MTSLITAGWALPVVLVTLLILKKTWDHFCSPLRQFQGPFLAKYTDLWRLVDMTGRRADVTHNKLHAQHGPAVLIGPNTISLSDPALIKVVFTHKPRWRKSPMYHVNDALANGVRIPNLNSMRDEDMHDKTIRPIRAMYSMSSIKSFEPLMDPVITRFNKTLESKFATGDNAGTVFDMGAWANYAAWDIMSEITFGKPFGFLDKGYDVGGFLKTSQHGLDYFAVISQMPWLDMIFDKNPVYRIGAPSFTWAIDFSVQCLVERYGKLAAQAEKGDKTDEAASKDFLGRFLDLKQQDPDFINDNMVVNFLLINVLAGSDTTAITLGAAVYYILKNPVALARLTKELTEGNLSSPVSWAESSTLPYLNACMQETMRIHGGVGIMLERVVPDGGFILPDGRYIPGGTNIGMNPWVVHRDEGFFGPNTDKFIPERWLRYDNETTEEFEAREAKMKEATLTFAKGPRTCLGRHLSRLEANKVIATLFKDYELALIDPKKDWHIHNSWFTYVSDINVTIKPRSPKLL